MPVFSKGDKILNILEVIRMKLPEITKVRMDVLDEYIKMFEEMPKDFESDKFVSALFPIEDVKSYAPRTRDYVKALEELDVGIAAIDSSSFNLGPHLRINLAVGNVGYWIYNYARGRGEAGNIADVFYEESEKLDVRIKLRELEIKVVREICDKIEGSIKIFMLDEALNMAYTGSWSVDRRNNMIKKTKELLEEIERCGAIPIGIFYTRAADILRGIAAYKGVSIDELIIFSDRFLLDRYLREGERTPLMKVGSKYLKEHGLEIISFYVKISRNNILRVEFPMKFSDKVDEIHLVVLATSEIGMGYPIPLQRAHENAVLKREDRMAIEREIARILRIPIEEILLSRKEVSKRWPIA